MSILVNNANGASSQYYGLSPFLGGLNIRTNLTITARIRFTSVPTTADRWGVIWGATADISGTYMGRFGGDPAGSWDCLRSNTTGFSIETADTTGYVADGAWRHFALTYDATNLRSYVNGVLSDTIASPTTRVSNTTSSEIYVGVGGAMVMCDVMLFNRALSAEELLRLVSQRSPGDVSRGSDLFAWYPLLADDFTRDYSGTGNHLVSQAGTAPLPVADNEDPGVPWGPRRRRIVVPQLAPISFSGEANSPTAATGNLRLHLLSSGLSRSPTAATGATAIRNQFSGSASSPSASQGTLQVRKFTAGTSRSPTASMGAAQAQIRFAGQSTSPTACVGALQSQIVFAGACSSPTACTGVLSIQGIASFAGVATSPTACTAEMRVIKESSALARSPTACAATLAVQKPTAALARSPTASMGTLRVLKYASVLALSPTACRGMQTGGSPSTPAGPEDPRKQQDRRWESIVGRRFARNRGGGRFPTHPGPPGPTLVTFSGVSASPTASSGAVAPVPPDYQGALGGKIWDVWFSDYDGAGGIVLNGSLQATDWYSYYAGRRLTYGGSPCLFQTDPSAFDGRPYVGARTTGARLMYHSLAAPWGPTSTPCVIAIARWATAPPFGGPRSMLNMGGADNVFGCAISFGTGGALPNQTRANVGTDPGNFDDLALIGLETTDPSVRLAGWDGTTVTGGLDGAFVATNTPGRTALSGNLQSIVFGAGLSGGFGAADVDAVALFVLDQMPTAPEFAAFYALAAAEYDL